MNLLNNLNISKKLAVGFAVVVAVVAVMCATVFASVLSIQQAVAANDESIAQLETLDAALTARVERQNAIRGLVASGDPAFQEKIDQSGKAFEAAMAEWAKRAPDDASKIAAVKATLAQVDIDEADQIAAGLDPTRQAEAMMTLSSKGRLAEFRKALAGIQKEEEALRKQRTAQKDAAQALSFTLLGGLESLLSAKVADSMTGRVHRSNMELVAQGLANIASAAFGGISVTGTIARTATNIRAGARSPVAGMLHAVFILVFMLVAAPLASYVPVAALAGLLVVVAWNMAEKKEFASLLTNWRAGAVLLATFGLTVLHDLMAGIIAGCGLALVFWIGSRLHRKLMRP